MTYVQGKQKKITLKVLQDKNKSSKAAVIIS